MSETGHKPDFRRWNEHDHKMHQHAEQERRTGVQVLAFAVAVVATIAVMATLLGVFQ